MQHNFISQGKIFISSKRASEISDYASDYVGQLCRAGKLDCTRVGHVWFVTEESLRSHMTKVWSQDSLRSRASNLMRRSVRDSGTVAVPGIASNDKPRISSKQAALLSGYAADYIGQLCRSGKLDGILLGKTWMVFEDSLKAHMEKIRLEQDMKRKADEIKKNAERELKAAKADTSESKHWEYTNLALDAAHPKSLCDEPVKTSVKKQSVPVIQILVQRSALALVAIALLVIGGSVALVRFAGVDNIAVRQPLMATVYNTAFSINDFVSGRGLAVAPRSGVLSDDQLLENSIRDSFSDEVNVSADESGTAGVITPVFKKTNGKDFMYVMVPVKDATSTSEQGGVNALPLDITQPIDHIQ